MCSILSNNFLDPTKTNSFGEFKQKNLESAENCLTENFG